MYKLAVIALLTLVLSLQLIVVAVLKRSSVAVAVLHVALQLVRTALLQESEPLRLIEGFFDKGAA